MNAALENLFTRAALLHHVELSGVYQPHSNLAIILYRSKITESVHKAVGGSGKKCRDILKFFDVSDVYVLGYMTTNY